MFQNAAVQIGYSYVVIHQCDSNGCVWCLLNQYQIISGIMFPYCLGHTVYAVHIPTQELFNVYGILENYY